LKGWKYIVLIWKKKLERGKKCSKERVVRRDKLKCPFPRHL
jgi:hypothetical protein